MAVVTYEQLVSSPYVTGLTSQVATTQSRFQKFYNMAPGGAAVEQVSGRVVQLDNFDHTRKIGKGRSPGTGPSTRSLQKVGAKTASLLRIHEKAYLNADKLFNKRKLGQPWSSPADKMGQDYVIKQTSYMAEIISNTREFATVQAFKGAIYLFVDGDDWTFSDSSSSANVTIDFGVPAGNKSKLDMLGDGDILATSWNNTAAPIIGDLMQIDGAMQSLNGRPLTDVWLNSNMIGYVLDNAQVVARGGSANTVFNDWARNPSRNEQGLLNAGTDIVLRGYPDVTFHVYNGGMEVGSGTSQSYTKFLPDNYALFTAAVDNQWHKMVEGSEIVMETRESEGEERFGITSWTEPCTQPAGRELITLDNFLPINAVPTATAYGTIVY